MSIEAELLARGGDPLEVAEALWLLGRIPVRARSTAEPPSAKEPTSSEPVPRAEVAASTSEPARSEAGPGPAGTRAAGSIARPHPDHRPLAWARALHRLGAVERSGARRLDLEATVDRSARTGQLDFAWTRDAEPARALLILEDTADQLAPWRAEVKNAEELARQSGRFHRVTRRGVDLRGDVDPKRVRAAGTAPLLVLVVTDGLASGVAGKALPALLRALPTRSLLVWAHPWTGGRWRATPALWHAERATPREVEAGELGALALLEWSPDGLAAAEGWVTGRGAGRLEGVLLPDRPPRARPTERDWERLADQVERDVPVSARKLLALAAGVPGRVDLALFRAFGDPNQGAFTREGIDRVVIARALSSGFLRRAPESRDELMVSFAGDDEPGTPARDVVMRRWLNPARAERLLQFLVDHLNPARGAELGIPYALLVAIRDGTDAAGVGELGQAQRLALRGLVELGGFEVTASVWEVISGVPGPGPGVDTRAWLAMRAREEGADVSEVVELALAWGVLKGRMVICKEFGGTGVAEEVATLLAGLGLLPRTAMEERVPDGVPMVIVVHEEEDPEPAFASVVYLAKRRPVVALLEPWEEGGPLAFMRPLPVLPSTGELVAALIEALPWYVPMVRVTGESCADLVDAIEDGGGFVVRGDAGPPVDHEVEVVRRAPGQAVGGFLEGVDLSSAVIGAAVGSLVRGVAPRSNPQIRVEIDSPMDGPLRWPAHANELATRLGTRQVFPTGFLVKHSIPLAYIPPGEFWMGSPHGVGDPDEHPRHVVHITTPLLVGITPVTQAQWRSVPGAPPIEPGFSGDDHPVERVSWYDAVRWCNALSKAEGRPPAYVIGKNNEVKVDRTVPGYRLPTEAEWEYLCRAGTDTRWSHGDEEARLAEYAWYRVDGTRPVGQKRPNPWGLYDVHGNAWEWCDDNQRPYSAAAVTDPAAAPGDGRVIRGGCWSVSAVGCRSAFRGWNQPDDRNYYLGFRVVLPFPRVGS